MSMYEAVAICPACGEVMDYCLGHGSIGDKLGSGISYLHHDQSIHDYCHPNADCQVDIDPE